LEIREIGLKMAIRGGKSPKITRMHATEAKVREIPRDRDNTDDLWDGQTKVHASYSNIQAPQGTKRKNAKNGAFDPSDNTAFNGNKVVLPPT
jgi:hypothetical protein